MSKRKQNSENKTVEAIVFKSEQEHVMKAATAITKEGGEVGVIEPPYDPISLTELLEYNSYHRRCCEIKASISVGMGYIVTPIDPNVTESADVNKINQFIDTMGRSNFINAIRKVQMDFEVFNYGFFEIERGSGGKVIAIYHIPAKYSKLKPEGNGYNLEQRVGTDTKHFVPYGTEDPEKREYIMLTRYSPKNVHYGTPEYSGALATIILDRNAVEYNANFFENNAIPASIVTIKNGTVSKETKEAIESLFVSKAKGVDNAGRTVLLQTNGRDLEIKVDKLSHESKDSSYQNLRKDNRDEIISAHGVPPRLIGVMSSSQLGGTGEVEQQLKMFGETTIKPRQEAMENILNDLIFRQGLEITDAVLKFNVFEYQNPAQNAEYYSKIIPLGILTPEEARQELGYPAMTENIEKAAEEITTLLAALKTKLREANNV